MAISSTEMQTKVDKTVTNMNRLDSITNGDATTDVTVDSGTVPSVAKFYAQVAAGVDAIAATAIAARDDAQGYAADAEAAFAGINERLTAPDPENDKLIATRGMMCVGFQAFTNMNSRMRFFMRDSVTSCRMLFANWYVATAISPGLGNITISAVLEYPEGRYIPLKWSSASTVTIAPGDFSPLCDPIITSIPEGAEFFVWTYQDAPSGCVVADIKDSFGGDRADYGTGVDKTMGGDIVDTPSQFYCYGPIAVIGKTNKPSVLILGDSRNHAGASDAHLDSMSNRGNIAHAIGGNLAYINCARGASTLQQLAASNAQIAALEPYVTDTIIQHGINDFTSGSTSTEVLGWLDTVLGLFPNLRKWLPTIEPVSTSTDGWITGANQTTHASNPERVLYNNAIRAGITGVEGFFEFANTVETNLNSGLWQVRSPGVSLTSDGTHMNDNGHDLSDEMGAIDYRRLCRYPEPVMRTANQNEWRAGNVSNKVLTPASIPRDRFFANMTSAFTIVNGTTTTLLWDNPEISGGGYYVDSNGRWYPPEGEFLIMCRALVVTPVESGNTAWMRGYRNGVLWIEETRHVASNIGFSLDFTTIAKFTGKGEYFYVGVNIGGTVDKTLSADASRTFFKAIPIG